MQSREIGTSVCLPCFSNRTYKNEAVHMSFIVLFTCSASCLLVSVLLLILAKYGDLTEKYQEITTEDSLYIGGAGLAGLLGTGILFFSGTNKNKPEEEVVIEEVKKPTETSKLNMA